MKKNKIVVDDVIISVGFCRVENKDLNILFHARHYLEKYLMKR